MKLIVLLLIFISPAGSISQELSGASHLPRRHRESLQAWLARSPAFRLATEADCQNKEGLKWMREEYGASYRPYYAAGDFNRDGSEDFAVVLVDMRMKKDGYAAAIFNGLASGEAEKSPAYSCASRFKVATGYW